MERGLSPRFIEFYQRLLRIQSEAEQHIGINKPNLTEETASERMESGAPLLNFDELAIDWALLPDIFARVATTLADYPDLFGEAARKLKKTGSRPSLTGETVKAWFERVMPPSTTTADDDSEYLLGEAVIHASLKPFLVNHAKALIGLVKPEQWRRRYCPICGGSPDFAFLDRERGARWLLCSRCNTEWLFQRLECPCCGTQDQNALAYFTDNQGTYRLYVCERCKQYLKAIDLRQTDSEVCLPLERLFTLNIDDQAQREGYRPCAKGNTR